MASSRWVKPGEMLTYARELKKRGAWPPRRPQPTPSPGREQVATPFIVVRGRVSDKGQRPLTHLSWINSSALRLLNTGTKEIDDSPRKGASYRILADIDNFGNAPCRMGFAEFFVADPIWIDNALGGLIGNPEPTKPRWLGVTPFSITMGASQLVQSPREWQVTTDYDLMRALVVRAYDQFGDRPQTQWDSRKDRHIARRDLAPDYSGTWSGIEINAANGSTIGPITIMIDAIGDMQEKAPFITPGGQYPLGDFECNITVQAIGAAPGRALNLAPLNNVQYAFGFLSWAMFSTSSLDPHAVQANFKLAQTPDGTNLTLTCEWGPDLSTGAGSSHAKLTQIAP